MMCPPFAMMCARARPPCARMRRAPAHADRGVCLGRGSSARDAGRGRRPAAPAAETSSSRSRRAAGSSRRR
eukprot:722116-Prymnesium_polylepis.1